MRRRVVVADFDGHLTEIDAEVESFRAAYLADVAELLGLPSEAMSEVVQAAEARIVADPERFGWSYDGHIAAAACADPYVHLRATCDLIIEERAAIVDKTARAQFLDSLFTRHNPNIVSVFKKGAREFLLALQRDDIFACVATNSQTAPVQKKLRQLGGDDGLLDWLVERVYGSAKKYEVDLTFDALDHGLVVPGLGRPVLLRRRAYYELIDRVRREQGCEWSDVFVAGDIFELDLATPLAAGANVVLVDHHRVPEYERAFVRSHPRAYLVSHPLETLKIID